MARSLQSESECTACQQVYIDRCPGGYAIARVSYRAPGCDVCLCAAGQQHSRLLLLLLLLHCWQQHLAALGSQACLRFGCSFSSSTCMQQAPVCWREFAALRSSHHRSQQTAEDRSIEATMPRWQIKCSRQSDPQASLLRSSVVPLYPCSLDFASQFFMPCSPSGSLFSIWCLICIEFCCLFVLACGHHT